MNENIPAGLKNNRVFSEPEKDSDLLAEYSEESASESELRDIVKGRNPIYASQYRFLSKKSQLRVWVEKGKYEKFKSAAKKNGTSIYRLINEFVDSYIGDKNEASHELELE